MSVASLVREKPKSLPKGTLPATRGGRLSNPLALRTLVFEQVLWEAGGGCPGQPGEKG